MGGLGGLFAATGWDGWMGGLLRVNKRLGQDRGMPHPGYRDLSTPTQLPDPLFMKHANF